MFHHEVSINLSKPQMSKLHKGLAVQLKHGDIGSGVHQVHLTHQQFRKMETAHRNGKGIRLHFNPEQVKHHVTKGFFDGLKKSVKDSIEKVGGKKGILKKSIGTLLDSDSDSDSETGSGLRRGRGRKGKGRKGKGFDFGNAIRDFGSTIAKPFEVSGINPFTAGYDLGHDVIAPALLGKGRKGKGIARKGRGKKVIKGGDAFTDFFTKTIPSIVSKKVDDYKENPLEIKHDIKQLVGDPVRVLGVDPIDYAEKQATGKGLRRGRGKGKSKKGGALVPSGYTTSGGALMPSGYGIHKEHHKMVKNGHIPFLGSVPPFYEAYSPLDSLAVKIL
jgi:hypothetical protein